MMYPLWTDLCLPKPQDFRIWVYLKKGPLRRDELKMRSSDWLSSKPAGVLVRRGNLDTRGVPKNEHIQRKDWERTWLVDGHHKTKHRPRRKVNLPTPRPCTSSFQNHVKINCLSHPAWVLCYSRPGGLIYASTLAYNKCTTRCTMSIRQDTQCVWKGMGAHCTFCSIFL